MAAVPCFCGLEVDTLGQHLSFGFFSLLFKASIFLAAFSELAKGSITCTSQRNPMSVLILIPFFREHDRLRKKLRHQVSQLQTLTEKRETSLISCLYLDSVMSTSHFMETRGDEIQKRLVEKQWAQQKGKVSLARSNTKSLHIQPLSKLLGLENRTSPLVLI